MSNGCATKLPYLLLLGLVSLRANVKCDVLVKYYEKFAATGAIRDGATNVILSTMWFSKLPFLIAPQAQMGFAVANNVNLLAACGIDLKTGAGGSGIYSGGEGELTMHLSEIEEGKMLVADVPKIPQTNENIGVRRHSFPSINHGTCTRLQRGHSVGSAGGVGGVGGSDLKFKNKLLKLQIRQHAFPLISAEFTPIKEKHVACPSEHNTDLIDHTIKQCCTFDLKFTTYNLPQGQKGYHYYFATYYGQRKFAKRNLGELFCAVVACTGTDPKKDCGQRYKNKVLHKTVNFESITIAMKTETKKKNDERLNNLLIMPSTLNVHMLPLQKKQYQFSNETTDKMKISVISTCNNDELYTFGFYGRNFNVDAARF